MPLTGVSPAHLDAPLLEIVDQPAHERVWPHRALLRQPVAAADRLRERRLQGAQFVPTHDRGDLESEPADRLQGGVVVIEGLGGAVGEEETVTVLLVAHACLAHRVVEGERTRAKGSDRLGAGEEIARVAMAPEAERPAQKGRVEPGPDVERAIGAEHPSQRCRDQPR